LSVAKNAKIHIGRSLQRAWRESLGVIEHSGRALCILHTESVGRSVIVYF